MHWDNWITVKFAKIQIRKTIKSIWQLKDFEKYKICMIKKMYEI